MKRSKIGHKRRVHCADNTQANIDPRIEADLEHDGERDEGGDVKEFQGAVFEEQREEFLRAE